MKQLIKITKKKLGYRYDREIAEALNLTKSAFSQKISRGDFPFSEIRQLLKNQNIDSEWLDEAETEMNKKDSTHTLNFEKQLLQEKERTIHIQQRYIERVEKTIERLEEDKKKWNP